MKNEETPGHDRCSTGDTVLRAQKALGRCKKKSLWGKHRYVQLAPLFFLFACRPMDGYDGRGPGWHMMPGGMGGYGILGILFWVVLIAIVVSLIVYLMRGDTARSEEERKGGSRTALDILEERYARGEIDKEEFEEKKRDLTR
jgi:putative membrane protein